MVLVALTVIELLLFPGDKSGAEAVLAAVVLVVVELRLAPNP